MHVHPVVGCSLGFLLLASSPVVARAAADPAGNDPELQALLDEAGNFTPHPGEPREAIKGLSAHAARNPQSLSTDQCGSATEQEQRPP